MSTFPIVLIPDRIKSAKNAKPPVPPFTDISPNPPSSEPQIYDTKALITYTTIGFVVSVISVLINPVLGAISGLVSIAAIAYAAWSMNQSYPQRKREHDDYRKKYPRLMQEHMRARDRHTEEIIRLNSPDNIAKYQQEQLILALKQTEPHDGENSTAQEGFSEPKFYPHLNHHFRGRIHRRLTSTNQFKPPYSLYSPDFAYIDRSLSLYIDIEIDEPYYHKTGEPTHYDGATNDFNRNNHFLAKNWLIIRFSEEQVVRYPKSCCKAIAQVIAEVVGDSIELRQFASVEDLQTIRQWTKSEAEDLAAKNYRQTYLVINNDTQSNSLNISNNFGNKAAANAIAVFEDDLTNGVWNKAVERYIMQIASSGKFTAQNGYRIHSEDSAKTYLAEKVTNFDGKYIDEKVNVKQRANALKKRRLDI